MLELEELDPTVREAALKFLEFYGPLVNHGRVPLRVKELARIRVASLNDCHY